MANSYVIQHGTRKRYQKGCRCEACRAAETDYTRSYRLARSPESPSFPHGTHTGYACKCRCEACVEFKHAYMAQKTPVTDFSVIDFPHGTHRGYIVGCRCDLCRLGEFDYRAALNAVRDFEAEDYPHGQVKGFKLGCRCEWCVEAKRLKNNAQHQHRMATEADYVLLRRHHGRITSKKRRACKNASAEHRDVMWLIYQLCPKGYEVDHIIPLSKGGPHTPENVQFLPAEINRRKNNKLDYDCEAYAIRWQDVLDGPSTTIPGMGVGSSEPKCSSTHRVEDIV